MAKAKPKGRILYQARGVRDAKAHWFADTKDRVSKCGRLNLDETLAERVPVVPGFLPANVCIVCRDIMDRALTPEQRENAIARMFKRAWEP